MTFAFSRFFSPCRVDKAVRMLEHMLMATPSGRPAGKDNTQIVTAVDSDMIYVMIYVTERQR